ncbi:MAG: DUF1540 domain-containing protein [Defluviitaleaceae bacterium]|nr:DUF1540 domain-containing protein [Defluviitaleaceae bacterium]MCL2836985.1 DUF1540 domain-containing protein [Defluviitaleaceae bacterium]
MAPNIGNQDINCGVHSCKYNDKVSHCTLQDIVVGNTSGEARTNRETECESFEAEA